MFSISDSFLHMSRGEEKISQVLTAMANGNGGASRNALGVLVPVSESSDIFHNSILGPLQNAYLYEESKLSFKYKSAFLINNATLQEKYETFRIQRSDAGYSEEDLKESYGFLLFDDKNKANKLGETGVVTGNSTCTTLGDPLKGVYVSKYSDCLDINRWYHGKTGYIAIIKLTKGRVKNVSENYTQNFTTPSEGFDCHVSEQLAAVSANTSSFLAFERTQYYMYELLDVGSNKTAQSPSHTCPFAIVSFSYGDTKATPSGPQEKSEEKKAVLHYFPWRGQLQISSHLFDVGLKSTSGALMPAKLPAVVKVDRAISIIDLRQLVPKAVFETCFSGEVSVDGMCCSLYELVPSEVEDTSLALLTQELMTKDLALTVQLNDGGFLILLHSSHFLTYDDARSNTTEVLQGMFVFPDSREIQRDTKVGWKKPTISSEILKVLPALNYAESEVEKCADQTGELCGLLEQHIQSYAALINPGLAASPSREASIFPDQYDVPDALKYLYSTPKWSSRAWQCFKSYHRQPGSFQLPVSRATELLEAGQEERRDDPDDEVYVFLSSPEEAPATPATICLEAHLEAQESPTHDDTSVDSHIASVGAQDETTIIPQNEVADILQSEGSPIDTGLSKTDCINEMKHFSISPTSSDLPTELIVSITSAEGTTSVLDRSLEIKRAVPVTMHCEVHLSSLSPAKLQMPRVNSLSEMVDKANKPVECPEISNTQKIKLRKLPRGHRKGRRISSKSSVQTSSLPEAKSPVDAESSLSGNHEKASQPSDHPEINNSSLSKSHEKASQSSDHQEMNGSSSSENHEKASQPSDHQEMNGSSSSENHEKASQPPDHQEMNDSSLSENHEKANQPPDHQEMNDSSLSEKCEKASQPPDHQEMNDPHKSDWRKLPRRRRKGGTSSSKYKRILRSTGVKVKEKEPEIMESIIVMEPEIHPLRKKSERWDLKPVITECGRIFVPHGSSNIIKHVELLKDRQKATDWEHCPDKTMVEASVEALQPMEIVQVPRPALEMKRGRKVTTDAMDGGGRCQNIDGSEVNSGQSKQSDDSDGSHTRKDTKETSPEINMTQADTTDSHAPEPIQKKHTDGPIPVQGTKKREFSLSKLKTVLLRGKRKTLQAVTSDVTSPGHAQGTENCVQGMEPSLKRRKADVVMEKLETDLIKGDQDTTVDTENVSKTPTLDPLLAQALCLTPKEFPDKTQKTQSRDILLRRDSSNVQDQVTPQTLSDKLAQSLQSPLSQISGWGRMKTLKKRQNVSRESVKKKWWLHFHAPASFSGEKPKSKVCTRNSSVRKNLKEKLSAACPPTDALTLLADLALSASNGQVPQQPDPALERKLDSSLETCDLTKDGPESESVLHALLRQPTARPILPPKSSSPKGLVGSKEVVVLITKEHAYSLPPSSSLLLGLSGAPFQVSPLSGSVGLRHLHYNMNSDGARALHAIFCQEGKSQDNLRASESLNKDMVCRRKFRRSRTFVEKDGSIQVTRLWKENYDFSLDSKFTNDSKDKTVTRALHGPWDFSIQDTNEQVQLIVHMWIGLFYSRSTARFFHFDSSLPCLEGNDFLEMSSETVPAQTTPDPKTSSSAPVPAKMPESKDVDLNIKETPVLIQESVVLDLSLRNPRTPDLTSDTQVNRKELPAPDEQTDILKSSQELEPSLELCESSTSCLLPAKNQPVEICREKADVLDKITKLDEDRSSNKSHNTSNLQKTSNLEHSDAVSCKKSGGTSTVLCEEMENVCILQENVLGTQETVHVLERSNNQKTEMRDCNENPGTAEGELVRQVGIDSSKIIVHEEILKDSNCDFANLIHPVECDENDINDGDHVKPIDKPHQKDNVESSLPAMRVNDTTNDETAAVGDVNLLKNDTRPTMQAVEESEALSLGQDEKVHEDKDRHPVNDCSVLGDEVHIGMIDGADLKDQSPTVVHTGSDFSDKALPKLYDGHGSREDKLIAECTGNISLAEKPPQVDNEKEAYNTSLLEVQCANEEGSTDEKTMPAQDHNSALETLPTECGDVSVDEATSGMIDDIHSRDEVLSKKAAYPVCKPPQVDNEKEAYNTSLLEVQCANEEGSADEKIMPAQDHNSALETLPTECGDVSVDEATSGMIDDIHSRDEVLSKKAAYPVCKPPQVDNEKEAYNTSLLEVQCANEEGSTDEKTMPAQDHNSALETLPTECGDVSVDEATSGMIDDIHSRDEVLSKKAAYPVCKPPQVDNEKEAYNTSLLEVQCANEEGSTDEKTMPAQDHNSALETLPTECGDVSVDEATSGMIDDIHSRDEVLSKKAAYPVCDKNTPTLDESTRAIPRSVDDIVGESLNEVKSDLSVLSSSDSEDKDTRLIESERKVDNHTPEITSITQQWQPSQGETSETPNGQIEIPLIGEADFGQDIASTQISLPKDEISESMHNHVEIPLIGIEAPWQETLHTQVSQNNTQEVVQDQKEIPLIRKSNDSASIVHTELDNTSQEKSEKAPLCAGKFIGFVHSDSNQKMVSKKRKSDNRCPTPTVDEKPYDDISCPNHFSSISASGGNNGVCKIFTGRELSRSSTPTQDELPLDQERNDSCTLKNILLPEPRVNNSLNLHCDLTLGKEQVIPDHELRTIRSLSPTEKQLCKSSHMTESRHFETTEMHIDQEQAPNPSNKPISTNSPPSHWSTSYSKGDKVDDNSCVASTSTKHQLHTKSVPNTLNSSRKLALKETDRPTIEHYLSRTDGLKDISLEQDSSISSDSMFNTAEFVRAVINQARGRATIQDNVPHEIHSHSQRPVMAVRPSKSDESGADYIFKEGQGYSSMTSDVPSDKPTKVAVHTHTTPSATILSRQTDRSSGVSEDINEQENTESCSKENWVSDDQDVVRRFNLDQAKLDLISVYQYQETDEQSEIGQTAEDWIEINEEDPQVVMSALVLDYKEKGKTNDVGPSTSPLKRTVYNSSSKGSKSLVDQPSERCSESDLTQSSMEQESLIFSERMSQLMKRNRRGTSYFKTNKYGRSKHCRSETTSCPSPVTVCFSSLREQEDSVEHWEALPSIVGQKIKVDMPERRGLAETAGGEKTLHPHKLSYGKGNPMAHAVVSDMTAGCARSYHAMMDDVCAGKKLPSKTVYPKMESSFSKVGASNHVDFSGQMKREMYDNLHSNLNSVVRQSCKTKFRFYILVTSADTFFEETKELLKGEGHTEVQPSQFFLGEESSSPLLIILRNEDIAEHICEVPHLLELKKSPGVLFAGIDQPDDIVSLTHQELFSRGGFVVFEGAALETLSLCNMKRISQFLEELSKKGRWKWLLHYRDSRHLKENARLTAEAMEKKRFIDCCQEAGMVEVLPYHECDIMSRDRPNYLNCLVRLQVQNISARYPVFITDTTADGAYGKNGILTMNINSFLLISESDTCTIS